MSRIKLGEKGFLYAITSAAYFANASMQNGGIGLVKIGATTLDPHERARQLSASTSSAIPFYVLHARPTDDVNDAEARAHEILARFRVNENREFFEITARQAIETIDGICGRKLKKISLPWSELFASFPDDGSERRLTEQEMEKCRELAQRMSA